MSMTIEAFDATLKDMYPRPGDRIKQWVVDLRGEQKWESETCPKFDVADHKDNTGARCRNSGELVPWTYLEHDCCDGCCNMHEYVRESPSVQTWLTEKANRPPIEQDRTKLSNEIAPDPSFTLNPWFARRVKR